MTKPNILVTGATGKTGAPIIRQLLDQGYPVRALVRKNDARSEQLDKLGAEIVIGDYLELQSLRNAMQGVQRAYFCYPPEGDRLLEASSNMAVAAKDAGVEALVNMSQLTSREGAPSGLTRQHWLAEQVLDWADIGAVHLRPTFFAEMLFIFGAQGIAEDGKLYFPYGDESHAPISAEDIARVAVAVLANPQPYLGARLVLTGPRNLTMAAMAEVLSDELGKSIEYVNLPIEHWGSVLGEQVGLPTYLVSHLKAVAQDHKDGVFSLQNDLVEQITGQPAQTLNEFIRSNREQFAGQSALQHV